MTDITGRHDAGDGDETAIAGGDAAVEHEALARSILDHAHEAFVAIDHCGRITQWNREAERTFGWEQAEVIGHELAARIVPERYREAHLRSMQRVVAGGPAQILGKRLELSAIHREGHEFPIELTVSSTPSGPAGIPRGFHAFLHDISARRLTQRVLVVMQAVTQAMARADSPEAAMTSLVAILGRDLEWDLGAYWARDPQGSLRRTAFWRVSDEIAPNFEEQTQSLVLRDGDGFAGWVAAHDEPVWIQDCLHETGFPHADAPAAAGLHAAIGVPVTRGGQVVGVLAFFTSSLRVRDSSIADAMATVGEQVGELLGVLEDRQSLMTRLEHMALTDQVTSLPNRRAWEQALERELARATRDAHPVCIAVLDLDGFKHYNDAEGHQAGDALLRATALAWEAELRGGDFIARYGGDEFAAVIPAWPLETTVAVVERLRQACPETLTCSAGVACWDGHESGAELFGRADAALYAAKQRGRDRTVATASD